MKAKLIVELLLCITLIFTCNFSFADDGSAGSSIWEQATSWISTGKEGAEEEGTGLSGDNTSWADVAGLLWGIGIWASAISGMILGIRFMLATPENKAEVKKGLMVWLTGTIVVVGALSIWRAVISFFDVF